MALSPEDRRDREKVNEAVRNGGALGPVACETADPHRVPEAEE
jgi:general stress protein YciG